MKYNEFQCLHTFMSKMQQFKQWRQEAAQFANYPNMDSNPFFVGTGFYVQPYIQPQTINKLGVPSVIDSKFN